MKKILFYIISLCLLLITTNINSQFVPEWVSTYPSGISGYYNYKNIISDQNDNYYIASKYYTANDVDLKLFKFNSSGQIQWSKIFFGNELDSIINPVRILKSTNGYIYLIGYKNDYYVMGGGIFVLKLDESGNITDSTIYKRQGNEFTGAADAVIDNNFNLYVTGAVFKYPNYDSLLTVKFNPNLDLVWDRTYADTISYGNYCRTISVDALGNVYSAGKLLVGYIGFFMNYDIVTMKYSSNGSLSWLQTYQYNSTVYDEAAFDLVLDANNNVLVTGYTYYPTAGNDTGSSVLLKYNNAGQLIWGNTYNIVTNGQEMGMKILLNNDYYVHVFSNNGSKLIKVNSSGSLLWNTSIPGNVNYLNFDNFNNIIFTGYQSTSYNNPLSIVKVSQNGTITQNYLYSYNGTGSDAGYYFKSYNDSKLYVFGLHINDLMFLKLIPSTAHNFSFSRNNVNKFILDSNYTYDTIIFTQNDLPLNAIIKDVNISIDSILHPSDGDLEISLIHNGFIDTLIYRRGGPFANFISTKLDDTASLNICSYGLAPFTGYFSPCRSLSKFNFIAADGPWILRIYDRKAPATGVLKAWSINITYDAATIGIKPISTEIPDKFSLSQNYPNPFNPATKIRFSLPSPQGEGLGVRVTIYDILGREITTLVNEQLQPGTYEIEWDASDYSSGVYFYTIQAGDYFNTKKMVLIK